MYEDLKSSIRDFPGKPGVYLMKNSRGTIIYIGKAKNLKKRVSSYFSGSQTVKTRVLVSKIDSIEYITTGSEYEALLLENNLIKEHTPRYNINLKDGKSYPAIRVTNEEFPRIFRTRRIIQDGSRYFGPYTDVRNIDIYLELIEKLFPLRKCRGPLKKREHPCLYYHIGRCSSPCTGRIGAEEYRRHVEEAEKLLSGETGDLIEDLEKKMTRAAGDLNFERAAELRDTIEAVKTVGSTQEVVDFDMEKRDYVAMAQRDSLYSFAVFQMRSGKMLGRDLYRAEAFGAREDAFSQFFFQYYADSRSLPDVIYTQSPVDGKNLSRFFREEYQAEVDLRVPEEGRDSRILRMAAENARQDVERRLKAVANIPGLEELREVLSLKKLPRRIEGFDIAQLSGKHPVASLVSFYNGNPDKKNYRRFHIKSLEGKIDDYEAIREAVARRYTRVLNEKLDPPDLLVIDGGRGQLNAALGILRTLGLRDLPVIALAKQFEEIYTPDRSEPIRLPDGAEGLRVLQAVRDETHRFATNFNKSLRRRDIGLPTLQGIPGVGPKRARALLEAFGSLDAIRGASPEQLAGETGIPEKTAEKIFEILSQKN